MLQIEKLVYCVYTVLLQEPYATLQNRKRLNNAFVTIQILVQ